jgi:hypothetical protein
MEDGTVDPASSQVNSRGITIFAPPQSLTLGYRYLIAGAAEDFWQENEFAAIVYIQDQGAAGAPAPWNISSSVLALGDPCDATQSLLTPRDYLSDLVKLSLVKTVAKSGNRLTSGNNAFYVAGPSPAFSDTFLVENQNTVLGANSASNPNYPALNNYVNITGVVHFTNNPASPNTAAIAGTFRICPRTAADIEVLGPAGVGDRLPNVLSFSAFPNPARSVVLSFSLPTKTQVDLGVYDLLGRKVTQIASGTMDAGVYTRPWNGTDASGRRVHSGVYYYRLRAGSESRTARTVLIDE